MTPQQSYHAKRWLKEGWTSKAVAARLGVTTKELRGVARSESLKLDLLTETARKAWKKATTDREKEIVWANYGDVLA